MEDAFLQCFGWVTELLEKRPASDFFDSSSEEYAIVEKLRAGWGKRDTAELLRELDDEYGERAGQAVEAYLERNVYMDWAETGRREAHEGKEIDDFIRLLWEPLKSMGFEYSVADESGRTTFCVSRCPVFELAQKTGMHRWLYHLACSTDFHSSRGFSPRLGFDRTKTLMQGDDCCNHQYYYKKTE
jgi:predicted ArsR family transcriptional regulator